MDYSQNSGLPSLMGSYGNIPQGMGQSPQAGGGNQYFPSMPAYQPQQQYQPQYSPQDWGGFAPGQLNAQHGSNNVYGQNNYGYGIMPPQQQYTPTAAPLNMSNYVQSQQDFSADQAILDAQKALQAQRDYHANNHF